MLERCNEAEEKPTKKINLPESLIFLEQELATIKKHLLPEANVIPAIKQILSENKLEYQQLRELFSNEELDYLIEKYFSEAMKQNYEMLHIHLSLVNQFILLKKGRENLEEGIDAELKKLEIESKTSYKTLEQLTDALYLFLTTAASYYHQEYLKSVEEKISELTRQYRRDNLMKYFGEVAKIKHSSIKNGIKEEETLDTSRAILAKDNPTCHFFLELIHNAYYANDKEVVYCLNKAYKEDILKKFPEITDYVFHSRGYTWDDMLFKPSVKALEELIESYPLKGHELHENWQKHFVRSNQVIKEFSESNDMTLLRNYEKKFQKGKKQVLQQIEISRDLESKIKKVIDQLVRQLDLVRQNIVTLSAQQDNLLVLLEYTKQLKLSEWKKTVDERIELVNKTQVDIVSGLQSSYLFFCDLNKMMGSLPSQKIKDSIDQSVLTGKYKQCVFDTVSLFNKTDNPDFKKAQKELDEYAVFESRKKLVKKTPLLQGLLVKQAATEEKLKLAQKAAEEKLREEKRAREEKLATESRNRVLRCLNLVKAAVGLSANGFVWQTTVNPGDRCFSFRGSSYKIEYEGVGQYQVPAGVKELHTLFKQIDVDIAHAGPLIEHIKKIALARNEKLGSYRYRFFVTRDSKTQKFYDLLCQLPDDLCAMDNAQVDEFEREIKRLGLAVHAPSTSIEITPLQPKL